MNNEILTPMKAIRAKCLDCCCDSANEVRECNITKCSLHPYRFGKNPNKRKYTEEQRKAMSERAKTNLVKNTIN